MPLRPLTIDQRLATSGSLPLVQNDWPRVGSAGPGRLRCGLNLSLSIIDMTMAGLLVFHTMAEGHWPVLPASGAAHSGKGVQQNGVAAAYLYEAPFGGTLMGAERPHVHRAHVCTSGSVIRWRVNHRWIGGSVFQRHRRSQSRRLCRDAVVQLGLSREGLLSLATASQGLVVATLLREVIT